LVLFLVFIAFILLRFFFGCPDRMCNRLTAIQRNLFFYLQFIIYWGLLIIGLLLSFLSSMKLGFVTLGCFLLFYNISIVSFSTKRIPILGNLLTKLIGIILLIVGLILYFFASWKYGLISLIDVLSCFLILKLLMFIEMEHLKKSRAKNHERKN